MSISPLRQAQLRFGDRLDAAIGRWLEHCVSTVPFAGMMRYQMGYADERFQPQPAPGGKRFRPLLCLLACEAAGGNPEAALDFAAAIELLHNFSLVHDDIEDGDETRRHRPTVWKLWGEAQGINVGDGMLAIASRASLAGNGSAGWLDLARSFQETALKLTEGQYLDMTFEARNDVTGQEYLDMIGRKTAALVRLSLWSGARIAGAGEQTLDGVARFGLAVGLAYQIHDDVMGIWGEPWQTGKAQGADLLRHKKTFPVLHAATAAGGRDTGAIRAYLAGEVVDPSDVRRALDNVDARSAAELAVQAHLTDAREALESARFSPAWRRRLVEVAHELTGLDCTPSRAGTET